MKGESVIHVLATIELTAGGRAEFLREFHRLVPRVQAEAGCLEYGPAVDADTDIAAQKRDGADVVVVIEKWNSLEALQAHLAAPHMVEYRPRVKHLVKSTTLRILEPA